MTFYDEHGRRLELVGEGHRGGEGSVHRIAQEAAHVAKIYHAGRLGAGLHTKLRVMLDNPPSDPSGTNSWMERSDSPDRHRSIAWVDGLVFADPSARELRGFTMPFVNTTEFRQAHVYYDASDRLQVVGGGFTWRHLLFAAHNLASAVAAVHAAGHRVGDLRETNLLVAPSALVTLIDCDSFQIRDPRSGDVYPTRVATGDYLPPELQGIDFRSEQPDRYHGDLFALAVLVFRFLMLGVHPFQGRGAAVADAPTTEAKIRKGSFAFAGRQKGLRPPTYAPPFSIVPPAIQDLVIRAFVAGHGQPDARPSATEWVTALSTEGHRLRTCSANPNHWYAHRIRTCPWCRMSHDPFPAGATVGRQIALEGAPEQVPEAARVEQLRAYVRVALADGAVTDNQLTYLRKAGGELGLRAPIVDRVVDEESRAASRPAPAATSAAPVAVPSVRSLIRRPSAIRSAIGNRRLRAAWKAAVPALIGCALAGALAPVVVPAAAVIALSALAAVGEIRYRRGWRARARAPLSFALHFHRALGHAARLFVPLALIGLLMTFAPGIRVDWVARVLGAVAVTALAWLAIARLPFSSDRSAPSLRAGRDLVWRALVGESGRTRRAAYVLWAACLGAGFALSANHALWWPLPIR